MRTSPFEARKELGWCLHSLVRNAGDELWWHLNKNNRWKPPAKEMDYEWFYITNMNLAKEYMPWEDDIEYEGHGG